MQSDPTDFAIIDEDSSFISAKNAGKALSDFTRKTRES
jgi:hypothetical protein